MQNEQQKVKNKIDGFLNKYTEKQIYGWKPEFEEKKSNDPKDTYIQEGRVPMWCPKCERAMNKKLDNKMYWIHNMCFDCVIEMETKLRIEGKWEEYEKNKIKENIRSYIKECAIEVIEYKKKLDEGATFVNVVNQDLMNVEYEKWSHAKDDIEKLKENADLILNQMHIDFEKTYGEKV